MRLQLTMTRQPSPRDINHPFFLLLQERMAERGGLTLTDNAPDVAHVFGAWDDKTAAIVADLHRRGVPVIYTSAEGLRAALEWGCGNASPNALKNRKNILRQTQIVHVCGAKERELFGKLRRNIATRLVYNPFFTSLTTEEQSLSEMLRLYQDTVETYGQNVRQTIAATVGQAESGDKNIDSICCQILYVKHMMLRGGITQDMLDSLANAMTVLQYDEEVMAETAQRLKIKAFASSLFCVLAKKASLTEGFMPFPMTEDKTSGKIEDNILTA